ncbi:MAG TPA: hypothetical protein PKX93_04005, partial [bacterium]|nr:hypothetical protein [bacterium]
MRCQQVEQLILECLTEGVCLPEEIQQHLKQCQHCQQTLAEIKTVVTYCRKETLPSFSEDFWQQRFLSLRGKTVSVPPLRFILGLSGSVAILVMAGLIFFTSPGFRTKFHHETASLQERTLLPSEDELFQLVDYLKEEDPSLG